MKNEWNFIAILARFLYFREILNIRDKNETSSFLNDFYICFSYSR